MGIKKGDEIITASAAFAVALPKSREEVEVEIARA